MRATVEGFEVVLDQAGGPGLLFDGDRADAHDQAIQVGEVDPTAPLWIIGDLHGDVLALEAALALIGRWSDDAMTSPPNIVLLGDLFDDDGLGLELLLRVFDLILASPGRICVVVGNHDEALSYDGSRFASSVSPGDFAEFLNANIAHEWIERAGKLPFASSSKRRMRCFFRTDCSSPMRGFRSPTFMPGWSKAGTGTTPLASPTSPGRGLTRPRARRCQTGIREEASSGARISLHFASQYTDGSAGRLTWCAVMTMPRIATSLTLPTRRTPC